MSKYRKTPTVFQMEATECGAASLSMIFAYWGKHMPLEQMRIETGVSRDGCKAGNIMRAAKRFGFECHGFSKELEYLKTVETPCIIHWCFNHFVVFEGFKGKYAYINDPAIGRRKLTTKELDEGFTGIVLTFKPTEGFVKQKKTQKLIPMIKERLQGNSNAVFLLILTGLILVIPGLIIPIASQVFIDNILISHDSDLFRKFVIFLSCTVLFRALMILYRSVVLRRLKNKLMFVSSKKILYRLFRLPINFFEQRYVGELSSRIEKNENISSFLAGDLAQTALDVFTAVFYFVLLICFNPILSLIGVFGMLLNFIIVKFTADKISYVSIKISQDKGKLQGALCAGLSITSTLKAAGAENTYTSRILGFDAKATSTEQAASKIQTFADTVPDVIGSFVQIAMIITGALFVINGNMTVGMLTAFISLFDSFSDPIENLIGFIKKIQYIKADMERVDDIATYPLDDSFADRKDGTVNISKLSGMVDCKDLVFGYSRLGPPQVEGMSFSLKPGTSVAFVGASGCGKSTVSKIVSGLYRPWEGQISFDGKLMKDVPADVLHASISTVSQNITLFSGTIRDNITLWNSAIEEPDIVNAAKDACIHDIITQKPGAYNFRLEENGQNLSGGQRQRLEIARALATNPTILIMDEATSALDPITEKTIVDNIKRRGCTCIIIAHRLSTIRDCDRIIVMKSGKMVESGTHEELIAANGYYKEFMKTE